MFNGLSEQDIPDLLKIHGYNGLPVNKPKSVWLIIWGDS